MRSDFIWDKYVSWEKIERELGKGRERHQTTAEV